jgi:hypothetical protein
LNESETRPEHIDPALRAASLGAIVNGDANMVATWDALQHFGFQHDGDVYSDGGPGLSFDFGRFKLSAGRMMNLQMKDVVSFSGVVSTPRTISSIEFEMPLRVESYEQCAAWIAWNFNAQMPRREKVIPRDKTDFLVYGMQYLSLLPWERRKAAYESRPRCSIERTWLRQGLNSIQKHIDLVELESNVIFSFDGGVLLFRGENWTIPMPATGVAWPEIYQIEVKNFCQFPSRLMNAAVEVSIRDGNLHLGNRLYRGVTVVNGQTVAAADL